MYAISVTFDTFQPDISPTDFNPSHEKNIHLILVTFDTSQPDISMYLKNVSSNNPLCPSSL